MKSLHAVTRDGGSGFGTPSSGASGSIIALINVAAVAGITSRQPKTPMANSTSNKRESRWTTVSTRDILRRGSSGHCAEGRFAGIEASGTAWGAGFAAGVCAGDFAAP
jgi:hypothetical protein